MACKDSWAEHEQRAIERREAIRNALVRFGKEQAPHMSPPPGRKRKRSSSATPARDKEASVLRECLRMLESLPYVSYTERRSVGVMRTPAGQYMKFGRTGAADLWCLVQDCAGHVRHVEVECKRRDGKGRLSRSQEAFQARMKSAGVAYLIVRSADELKTALEKLL